MRDGSPLPLPSRVLRFDRPTSSHQRWTAVVPSPDRQAVLLQSRNDVAVVSINGDAEAGGRGSAPSLLLPQPHRRLTAACWLSTGWCSHHPHGSSRRSATSTRDASTASSLAVAIGDASSSVTIMRQDAASSSSLSPSSITSSTIFIGDPLQQLQLQCSPCVPAIATLIACSYTASGGDGGSFVAPYFLCQREGGDLYAGSGTAAIWMVSVEQERSWMLPLPFHGTTSSAGPSTIPQPRLLDVRRRRWDSSGPPGAVVAAAYPTDVVLHSSTTAEPRVAFRLPAAGNRPPSWCVTSVVAVDAAAGPPTSYFITAVDNSMQSFIYDARWPEAPAWIGPVVPSASESSATHWTTEVLPAELSICQRGRWGGETVDQLDATHAVSLAVYTPPASNLPGQHRGTCTLMDWSHDRSGRDGVAPIQHQLLPPPLPQKGECDVRSIMWSNGALYYLCG